MTLSAAIRGGWLQRPVGFEHPALAAITHCPACDREPDRVINVMLHLWDRHHWSDAEIALWIAEQWE